MSYQPNLGTCCACGGTRKVYNMIMLHKLSPTPGRGWGCFVCNLPSDGAMAVVCNRCIKEKVEIKWACKGYPGADGRVPIDALTGSFDHIIELHPELQAPCVVCSTPFIPAPGADPYACLTCAPSEIGGALLAIVKGEDK